jgi:hypothetical protein
MQLQNRVSGSDKRNCSRKNPSAGQSIIVPGNECWSPATTTVGGALRREMLQQKRIPKPQLMNHNLHINPDMADLILPTTTTTT